MRLSRSSTSKIATAASPSGRFGDVLAQSERLYVESALAACDGNKAEAAALLGITPATLNRLLQRPLTIPSRPQRNSKRAPKEIDALPLTVAGKTEFVILRHADYVKLHTNLAHVHAICAKLFERLANSPCP